MSKLSLSFGRHLPLILQNETTECGLVCIGMIAGYYGHSMDLPSLRGRFSLSLKGVTLEHLIQMATELKLGTRALKLDLQEMNELRLPCILHWDLNHFVVLKSVHRNHIVIHDPAHGRKQMAMEEVSRHFTGIALEAWPVEGFKPQKEEQLVSIRRLIGDLRGLSKGIAIVLFLAFCIEVFALVSPLYLQWTIDNVIISNDQSLLVTLAIGFTLVLLLQQLTTALRSYVLMYLSTNLNIQWLSNVFSHLINLPVVYFEKRHVGDVVSRFHAVDNIQQTLTSSFFSAVLDGIMSATVLVMMWVYSPKLAIIAIIAMTLYLILRIFSYQALRCISEKAIIYQARQQSHFLETIRGIKTIKLFGRQQTRKLYWQNLLVDQINAGISQQKFQLIYGLANGILFGIEHILVIYFAADMVISGNFTVGALTAFIAYKQMFDSRIAKLIEQFFQLRMLSVQTGRLGDIVLTDTESIPSLVSREQTIKRQPIAITVENLKFRYSDFDRWVLDGVSFSILAGESVALVGASGCGKSTLVNVLLGILPVSSGKIIVDGVTLANEDLIRLRHRIGTVMQDDVLFAGSVMDNITFFDPNADEEKAKKCALLAAIAQEIEIMPMGYNTLIGDMGTVLSGGQKQRILLARAIYRSPDLLCLDEATSNLDLMCEYAVNTAIKQLPSTRLIIAHRPETIASADRVLILEQGKIKQDISSKEFMRSLNRNLS